VAVLSALSALGGGTRAVRGAIQHAAHAAAGVLLALQMDAGLTMAPAAGADELVHAANAGADSHHHPSEVRFLLRHHCRQYRQPAASLMPARRARRGAGMYAGETGDTSDASGKRHSEQARVRDDRRGECCGWC
jgi:hypothetical protein